MGGGNLNLKKSWHPSTLRNQERVWKAQQQDESEKKKMEELRQELQVQREKEEFQAIADRASGSTEKKNKMDWMYKGVSALVDREDYLMGRKVDKTFDVIKATEEREDPKKAIEEKCEGLPSQLFKQSQSESDFVPVDMAVKVREDPLYMIKKQEYESKKLLLSNPVKMKMLQEMISKEKSKKHKKGKKKEKKNKKNKKHRKATAESSSSNGNSSVEGSPTPEERVKYRREVEASCNEKRQSSSSSRPHGDRSDGASRRSKATRTETEKTDAARWNDSERNNIQASPTRSRSRHRSRSPTRDRDRQKKEETTSRRSVRSPASRHRSSPASPKETSSSCKAEERPSTSSGSSGNYGLIRVKDTDRDGEYAKKDYRRVLEDRRRKEEKERRDLKERLRKRSAPSMTQEEREARLREMQQDAHAREKEREAYVRMHTKGDAIEVEGYKEGGFRAAEMLARAVDETNVERRIKSNLKGIQRGGRGMESNFLRK